MTVWSARELRPLVGDLRQLASVRRVVLDDGAERGVRALLFSTGGGLDFTVLSDRSMDIGVVSWRGIPVSWQSPAGFAAPSLLNAESDSGTGFNRGFSGFLVTCGLDHIRFPAEGRPQHGRLPFTPASIKSYGEDWSGSVPALHCAGEVVQARYGGEGLRLSRRIEAPVGGSEIVLHDVVENVGANSVPQPMLYHFNLGYPAIANGTTVELNGQMLIRPISLASADGLVRARSWPTTARKQATCTVRSPFGPSIRFTFETETLRHLQLWHDLRPNVGVLSIEPCTSERRQDDVVSSEASLKPGETRTYRLLISFDDVSIGARSEGKD